METRGRTLAKAVSWQAIGLVIMTALAWVLTGSAGQSVGFAVISCTIGFVSYVGHERLWQAIPWGVQPKPGSVRPRPGGGNTRDGVDGRRPDA